MKKGDRVSVASVPGYTSKGARLLQRVMAESAARTGAEPIVEQNRENELRSALEYVVARLDALQRTVGWTEEDSPGSGCDGATWAGSYVLDAQDRARAALAVSNA